VPDLLETNDEGVQWVRFYLPVGSIRDQRECTRYVIFLIPRDQKELVLEVEDEGGTQRNRARFPKLPPVGQ
jgi:hypothetical protein